MVLNSLKENSRHGVWKMKTLPGGERWLTYLTSALMCLHTAVRFTHDFTLMGPLDPPIPLWPAWHSPLWGEEMGMPGSGGLSPGRGRARTIGICNSRAS